MKKSRFFILIAILVMGLNFISCDNEPIDPALLVENPEVNPEFCPAPALFSASEFIDGNKVTLNWDGDGGAWQIQYGAEGFALGSGTAITATDNTITITGLTATNEYDFYIRTTCGAEEFSEWIGPVSVGTVIVNTCAIPSGITAARSNDTTANVVWFAASGATQWEVQYGAAGFALGTGTILNTTAPTAQITGLLANRGYDFYVRTVCSPTSTSTWAGPVPVNAVGTTPGTVDTTPALMTANIDGVQYNVLRPFFYQVLGNDINVENDGADPEVPRFIKLQGTDNTTTVNTSNSREINLYIPDTMWQAGTYPLNWESGFEAPLCWVRFIVFSDPDIDARITEGSLTVTEFNRTTKRIKGTFEFTYEKINDDGDVIGIARVTNGTFNYGLDDPYFD